MNKKLKVLQTLNNLSKIKQTIPNLFAGIDCDSIDSIAGHSYRVCYLCLMFGYGQKDINMENLLKWAVTYYWGESIIGNVPTGLFPYASYFDEAIREVFKKAEGKAKQALLHDAGIKPVKLNNDEIKMYRFCDVVAEYIELIDLRQQGYTHNWINETHRALVSKLKRYDYPFVNELLVALNEIYQRGYMENKYLTKETDRLDIPKPE